MILFIISIKSIVPGETLATNLGIADDRTIVGLLESEVNQALEYLNKAIFENCTPPIVPHVNTRRINDKLLIVIELAEGMAKPYFITSSGLSQGTYMRLGRSSIKANAQMIAELQWRSRGHSSDEMPIYRAASGEVELDKFRDFLKNRKGTPTRKITEIDSLLRAYRIVIDEQKRTCPTIAGLMCFGKEPQKFLPECYVVCTRFKGESGRNALESIEYAYL